MPAGDVVSAPHGKDYSRSDGKIPSFLSNFVGRSRDVAKIQELLQDDAYHLVTLTGPSGVGKTRLAARVATTQLDSFKDGVCWVDLGSLIDPSLVQQTVISALGLTNGGVAHSTEQLVESLRDMQLLLVLDNCDHLLEHSASLARSLLHTSPGLRILATSNENLNIVGESSWPVSGLTFPDNLYWSIESNFLFEFMGFDAIKLFRDRAMSALSVFRLTSTTVSPVIDICQQLQGLPLSIELAAARIRMMGVNQIAEQIDERLEKSNGSNGSKPSQHRSLYAVLNWSHDLLLEEEKILLRRLSVFQDAFSLDAAEAIATDDEPAITEHRIIKRDGVLEILASLIEKSFVTVARPHDERTAYKLPDTIRQFATSKLSEAGESEAIHAAYLRFYQQLVLSAVEGFRTPEHPKWIWLLEAEHGNLRNAMDWALGQAEKYHDGNHKELLVEMTARLLWFWYAANHLEEGRNWIDQALSLPEGQLEEQVAARAMWAAGILSWILGELGGAEKRFESVYDLLVT